MSLARENRRSPCLRLLSGIAAIDVDLARESDAGGRRLETDVANIGGDDGAAAGDVFHFPGDPRHPRVVHLGGVLVAPSGGFRLPLLQPSFSQCRGLPLCGMVRPAQLATSLFYSEHRGFRRGRRARRPGSEISGARGNDSVTWIRCAVPRRGISDCEIGRVRAGFPGEWLRVPCPPERARRRR